MAGIKYQCEFYSNNGSRYRMNLYHVDYSGTTIPFVAGPEGFQLTYEGQSDSVYQCIKASSLQFDFVVEEAPTSSGDPTTGNIYADLLANNENKMFVIVQQYDSDNTAWRNFWAGDIIDDTVVIEDAPYPFSIRIKATDGIAKIKQKVYISSAGGSYLPILWFFQKAIEQTTYYSTLFPSSSGTSAITIRNNPDRYHENMGSITDSTWQDTYNPMKLVYVNESAFVKQDGTYMTYYEIINQICTLWNCQFFLSSIWNEDLGCTWWLFSRNIMYFETGSSILDTCRVFKNQAYDAANTALTYAEYSVPNTSVNYTPTLTKTIGDADHPKFSGNKITYVAPLGRVEVNYNHDLFAFSLNANLGDAGNWSLSANASYYNFQSIRDNATTGTQFFVGDLLTTVGGTLNSPEFPSGMDYTAGGNNNQGLFIPITSGQDAIIVTGTMTFNYKFSWSNATLDAMVAGGGLPASFNSQLYMYLELSDKSFYDWNDSVYAGTNLNDNIKNIYLTGDFGNGGDGTTIWSDTVAALPDTSLLKVHIDSLPIQNGVEQTITVPFTFFSESIQTSWGGSTYPYLKRMKFGLLNFNDSNMFGQNDSLLSTLISGGIITCDFANIEYSDFHINYIFDSSEMSNYFSKESGLFINNNTAASAQMTIAPELFIGDPPEWISNSDGELEVGTSPAQYLGGLKIVAPAASNPTTTPPNQAQQNNRKWRCQQDGTFLPLHQLLCREIIKKRCVPSYKYDISFENNDPATTITFINTLKIDMKINNGASADLAGFFPTGGTYTAGTDSWKMTVEQFSINTESNLVNGSNNIFLVDWFIDNPNILIYTNL